MPNGRLWAFAAALGLAAAPAPHPGRAGPVRAADTVLVYKSPTCGCCTKWVDHLRRHGFVVLAHDTADVTPLKIARGVPAALRSCHTADVAGYVIEGHVPADLIARLLRERPRVRGLAVPDMPSGSPGMETGRKDPYRVLTFDARGRTTVYAER